MEKYSVLASMLAFTAFAAASSISADSTAQKTESLTPQQIQARYALEQANKEVAIKFFKKGITPAQMQSLMDDDYTQHDPMFKRFGEVKGIHGIAEFGAVVTLFQSGKGPKREPQGPGGDPTYAVMADGDLVTVLQKRMLPDPQYPGRYYEAFWFDTWRIRNGKLYEHWDAATIPNPAPDFLNPAPATPPPSSKQ